MHTNLQFADERVSASVFAISYLSFLDKTIQSSVYHKICKSMLITILTLLLLREYMHEKCEIYVF